MDKCEKCGFLECRCPDHVAQNYVPKDDLRKLRDELAKRSDDKEYVSTYRSGLDDCVDMIDELLEG